MDRTCSLLLLLGITGCVSEAPLEPLRIRLETADRLAEGPLGALRLDLDDAHELLVRTRLLDPKRVHVAGTILQNGRVVDEPDFVVDVDGSVKFGACLGPARPIGSLYGVACPLTSEFARFEPPLEARVRLSVYSKDQGSRSASRRISRAP